MKINFPGPLQLLSEQNGQASPAWFQFFNLLNTIARANVQSGITANRPNKGVWIGRPYFDTSLGYMVWLKSVSPTVWVNGAGASV